MSDLTLNEREASPQTVDKPMAVWVFGVLNIVFGCYFMVRTIHSRYKIIAAICKNPEQITRAEIPYLLLLLVIVGLAVWLIALGIGLLTMKRWARRGSIIYARIQIVFIVITLGAIVISSITDWKTAPRTLLASITLDNAIAVIHWIYMVLLLVFMKTGKVKQAFAAIGG
jgi:hypothetical protein